MNGYGDNCTQYFNRDRISRQEKDIEKLKEQIEELKRVVKSQDQKRT